MDGVMLIYRWMMTWIVNFGLSLPISGCIYYFFSLLSVKLPDTRFHTSDVVSHTCLRIAEP